MSQTYTQPSTTTTKAKARSIALWVLQIALATFFLMGGVAKLTGDPMMVDVFEAVGIGQWFRYVTGLLEFTGAVLLLIPALAGAGAVLLGTVMVGAIFTHLFVIGGSALMALVLLIALGGIAYARRDRILGLATASRPGVNR